MTARHEHRLEQALRALASALTATGASWMIIGGIAVIARGVRRFTSDIDAAILGDEIDVSTLIKALAKKRIVPRIARAEAFARENLVLLLHHEPSGVELDVSLAWTQFEHEAIAAASAASFGTVKAPMAQPEDLIVFKAIAGRGKDMDDVTALLTLYPKVDLARIRAHVRDLAAIAETPELVAGLETAVAAAVDVRAMTDPSRRPRATTNSPMKRPSAKPRTQKPPRKADPKRLVRRRSREKK